MDIISFENYVSSTPDRIKWILNERGITQVEAAEYFSMSKSDYNKYFSKKRKLSYQMLALHCVYLNVSLSFLLTGDESLNLNHEFINEEEEIEWLFERMAIQIVRMDDTRKYKTCAKVINRLSAMILKENLKI